MGTQACREGKKLYWDRRSEQIVDHPVAHRTLLTRTPESTIH